MGPGVLALTLLAALGATAEQPPKPAEPADARSPAERPDPQCEEGSTLASGDPESSIFSAAASQGVRASWCERYDAYGRTTRVGPYREHYASGALRTAASYVNGRFDGPLEIYHEDGRPWLRTVFDRGVEQGPLEIFHPGGALWLHAELENGRLHGRVRSHYPDGAPESVTRFAQGREQGMARSYHPAAAGGGLRSEVRVEDDRLVGPPRLFDVEGQPRPARDPHSAKAPEASFAGLPSAPTRPAASEARTVAPSDPDAAD